MTNSYLISATFLFFLSTRILLTCNPPVDASISNAQNLTTITANINKIKTRGDQLAQAAESTINPAIIYDPAYFNITYPNGDVPANKGVCTDVVIRSFRKMGIDLQKNVHEDMKANFNIYPNHWGMRTTDKNIDHRRVPNLMKYFERKGYQQKISNESKDYLPGDIVAWRLNNGLLHIGIVIHRLNATKSNFLVVHNIGNGQIAEDILFSWKIIGHYRFPNK